MPDDREYLTVREFAGLSSNDQHAVWRARSEGRVDTILASAGSASGPLRYHREQVRALLCKAEAPGVGLTVTEAGNA